MATLVGENTVGEQEKEEEGPPTSPEPYLVRLTAPDQSFIWRDILAKGEFWPVTSIIFPPSPFSSSVKDPVSVVSMSEDSPYVNLGEVEPVNLISFAFQIASGMVSTYTSLQVLSWYVCELLL